MSVAFVINVLFQDRNMSASSDHLRNSFFMHGGL